MQNIRLSHSEFQQVIEQVSQYLQYPAIGQASTLYGYPLKSVSDGYVIFVACEFCDQALCRCGAPVEWQGQRLTKRAADGALLSAILEALHGTPRR